MADKPSGPPATPWQLTLIRRALRLTSGLSPRLAGRWANFLWYRTHPMKVRPREQKLLDEAEGQTLDCDGTPVRCYAWGAGPGVLLVHGWNGQAAQMTPIAAALVENGFRVVAFDAPAHGNSPGKRTELPVISHAILAIERQLGPFRAGITHSFGGMCLLYAIEQGLKLERVACIAPPLDVSMLVDQFANTLQLDEKTLAVHRRLLENRFGEAIWTLFSMPRWAAQMRIPGLIIHDEQDSYVDADNGKQIAAAWPDSELVLTSGLGHSKILKNRSVIDRLAAFLAPLTAAG